MEDKDKTDEVPATPEPAPEQPQVGSAAKPALAPTPEVENTDGSGAVTGPTGSTASTGPAAKRSHKGEVSFTTSAPVQFTIEGKVYQGTHFSFPKDVVEDRKRIVKDAYPEVEVK